VTINHTTSLEAVGFAFVVNRN